MGTIQHKTLPVLVSAAALTVVRQMKSRSPHGVPVNACAQPFTPIPGACISQPNQSSTSPDVLTYEQHVLPSSGSIPAIITTLALGVTTTAIRLGSGRTLRNTVLCELFSV